MAFSKKKINLIDIYQFAIGDLLASPEYFESDENLLKMYPFNQKQLKVLEVEQIKLAIVYVGLYVEFLVRNNRIGNYKDYTKEELTHLLGVTYGAAVTNMSRIVNFDSVVHTDDTQSWLYSMDGYTMYIVQNNGGNWGEEDFFLAYKYFENLVFGSKNVFDEQMTLTLLAKYLRENIAQPIVMNILKKYRLTNP